ncbi:hypothetical protein CPB83DRAFT_889747 [Crepidotus variabilis]|uniref:C2H2-type domain-containing protein n=1 Tax=Crepidotus variabilis TaxID=179855 RepID=A0A9P6ERR9_9AGAR|nr:hypothetical protein CPB83DRAFT_889747 [Crepidotus variabilis]
MQCECGLQTLFEDIVNNTLVSYTIDEKHEHFPTNPKRFGVYIPSAQSLFDDHITDADDDSDSSWAFSAPNRHSSSSSRSQLSSGSTPAQELVARYRNGQPVLFDETQSYDTPPTTPADSPKCFSPAVSFIDYGPESEYGRDLPPVDGQFSRPLSSVELLSATYEEASKMAQGLVKSIPCKRPRCSDVLADVKALMYHLHIHEIDSRLAHPSIQLSTTIFEERTKSILASPSHSWRKFSLPSVLLRSVFRRLVKRVIR